MKAEVSFYAREMLHKLQTKNITIQGHKWKCEMENGKMNNLSKLHQMRRFIISVHCEREKQRAVFQNAKFTSAICCLMRSLAAFSSAFSLFLSSNIRLVSSSSCRLLYSNISLPVFLLSISFLISFCIERYKNWTTNCLGQEKRLKYVCLRRN